MVQLILVLLGLTVFGKTAKSQSGDTLLFRLDTRHQTGLKKVGLRGSVSPLRWDRSILLTDSDGDGIMEASVVFPAGQPRLLEFKFVQEGKKPVYELEAGNRLWVTGDKEPLPLFSWDVNIPLSPGRVPPVAVPGWRKDLEILKRALVSLHPGIYRHLTPAQMDSLFLYWENHFQGSIKHREAFLALTNITAALRCGHTYPNFYNQSDFIVQWVLDQPDKLPFAFRMVERRMFVTADASDDSLLMPGTEVLSLNDVPVKEIVKELAFLVKADGGNKAKREIDLSVTGVGKFEMFDAYYPLVYNVSSGNVKMKILYPGATGDTTIILKTVTRKNRIRQLALRYPDYPLTDSDGWKLDFWDDGTAYLRLSTFDVFQLSFEWRIFLKNAFEKINQRNAPRLILDIRGNEGGQDEVVDWLGRHITQRVCTVPQRISLLRYQQVPDLLKPYLYTWDKSFFDKTKELIPDTGGYYRFRSAQSVVIRPADGGYKGPVFLLINASNSSATFYLADAAHKLQLATLVGETTGGSQRSMNGGQFFFLRLPNTGIEVDIPLIGQFEPNQPDEGVHPHVRIKETPETVRDSVDPVLEWLRRQPIR